MEGAVTSVAIPLRWVDLDLQGHVNNSLAAEYLQEARAGLLEAGPNAHLVGGGVLVVGNRVEYRREINFSRRPLVAQVGVFGVGASRFSVGYELWQDDELCVRASTLLCPFDFETQRPRRLTTDERGWFLDVAGPEPDFRHLPTVHLHGAGHRHELAVRWGDIDRYGHVNNVRHFDYVQEARIAMTTALDPTMSRDGGAERWVVARQDVDYLAQIDHRSEPYEVHTAVTAIGRTSFTMAAEIVDPLAHGRVLARSRTIQVCTDADGVPTPLGAERREALGTLLVS